MEIILEPYILLIPFLLLGVYLLNFVCKSKVILMYIIYNIITLSGFIIAYMTTNQKLFDICFSYFFGQTLFLYITYKNWKNKDIYRAIRKIAKLPIAVSLKGCNDQNKNSIYKAIKFVECDLIKKYNVLLFGVNNKNNTFEIIIPTTSKIVLNYLKEKNTDIDEIEFYDKGIMVNVKL